jgi:hypothetical protein
VNGLQTGLAAVLAILAQWALAAAPG